MWQRDIKAPCQCDLASRCREDGAVAWYGPGRERASVPEGSGEPGRQARTESSSFYRDLCESAFPHLHSGRTGGQR